MIEIKSKLRRWGNSFGVVLPASKLSQENFSEGEEITLLISKRKKNVLRETFGAFKFKKPVAQMMQEIDEELYNE